MRADERVVPGQHRELVGRGDERAPGELGDLRRDRLGVLRDAR